MRLKLGGPHEVQGIGVFVRRRALTMVRLRVRPRALYARSLSAVR